MTVGSTGPASLQAAQAQQAAAQKAYNDAMDADRGADAATYTLQSSVNTDQSAVTTAQSAYDAFGNQISTAQSAATTADTAVTTAKTAATTADTAFTTAQAAETTAQTAVTTATTAETTATTALTTAGTALTTATTAQTTADTAKKTADATLKTADDLVKADGTTLKTADADLKTAQDAQKTADKAVTDDTKTLKDAGTALTKAQGDVKTATADVATANAANDKAQAAIGPAQGVLDSANGALTKASSAVTSLLAEAGTADTAASNAEGEAGSAEGAANSAEARARANPKDAAAQSAAQSARSRATTARNKANQARAHAADVHRRLDAARDAETKAKAAVADAEKKLKAAKDAAAKTAKDLADKQKALQEKTAAQTKAQKAKDDAQTALDAATKAAAAAKAKADDAKVKRDTAKTKLDTDTTAAKTAKDAADKAKKAADDAKTAVDKAKADKTKAQDAADKAKDATAKAKTALATAKTKTTDAKAKQATAKTAVDKATADAKIAHGKVTDLTDKQTAAKSKLDGAKTKLGTDTSALTAKTTAASAAQAKITSTKSALDAATSALKSAQNAGMSPTERKLLAMDGGDTAAAQAQAKKDAAAIDKAVTDKEAARLKADQDELDRQLAAARSVKSSGDANSTGMLSFLDKARSGVALTSHEQALYSEYFATHQYYVDNGTVYSASYDASGKKIVLDRNGVPVQPAGTKPGQFVKDQNIAIANSGARDSSTTVKTTPTTDGSASSFKEVVHTDAGGKQTGRETTDTNTKVGADKTVVTTTMQKQMDEADRLRKAQQTTTAVNGTKTETQTQGAEFDTKGRATVETTGYKAVDGAKSTTKSSTTNYNPETGFKTTEQADSTNVDGTKTTTSSATVNYDSSNGFRTSEHAADSTVDGAKKTTQVSDTNFANDLPTDTKIKRTDSSKDGQSGNEDQALTYDATGKVAHSETATYDKDGTKTMRVDDAAHVTGVNYVRDKDNHFQTDGSIALPNDVLKPSATLTATVTANQELLNIADAKKIDASIPASGSAQRAALQDQQTGYDAEMRSAKTPAERDAVMAKYWKSHDVYFATAPQVSDQPLALAAQYTSPSGSDKPYGYVTMARTGQVVPNDAQGVTTTADILMRQDAQTGDTSQTVSAKSRDGKETSVDEVFNTVTNPGGKVTLQEASRTTTAPGGVGGSQVSRKTFDDAGKQLTGYDATSSYDGTDTKLSERTDSFANGVISGSKIHQDDKSRDWNQGAVDSFDNEMDLFANDLASGASFNIDKDHNKITVPTTGTHRTVTDTDIQYDAKGQPIYQTSAQKVWDVQSTRDIQQKDGTTTDTADANGVKVTASETNSSWGTPNGTTPIMDDKGNYTVAGTFDTHLRVRSFDPDDGKSKGHQLREVDDVTTSGSIGTDGKQVIEHSGPFTKAVLTEDGDDDWYYHQDVYKTDQKTGAVATNGDGEPQKYGQGDSYWDPATKTQKTFESSPNKERHDNEWTDEVGQWWDEHSHIISSVMMIAGTVLAFTPLAPAGVALLAGGGAIALSNDLPAFIDHPSFTGALAIGLDAAAIIPGVGEISAMGEGFLSGARLAEEGAAVSRFGEAWSAGKAFLKAGTLGEDVGTAGKVANAFGKVQKVMSVPLLPAAGDAGRLARVGSSLTSINGALGAYAITSQVVDSAGKIADGQFSLLDAGQLALGVALTGHGLRAAGWGPSGVSDSARAASEMRTSGTETVVPEIATTHNPVEPRLTTDEPLPLTANRSPVGTGPDGAPIGLGTDHAPSTGTGNHGPVTATGEHGPVTGTGEHGPATTTATDTTATGGNGGPRSSVNGGGERGPGATGSTTEPHAVGGASGPALDGVEPSVTTPHDPANPRGGATDTRRGALLADDAHATVLGPQDLNSANLENLRMHGLRVENVVDPATGESTMRVIKNGGSTTPFEYVGGETFAAAGLEGLRPDVALRADGGVAMEYLDAQTASEAGVRSTQDLVDTQARYHESQGLSPEAAAAQARIDVQSINVMDYVLSNNDRGFGNIVVDSNGRVMAIDHEAASINSRAGAADPLTPQNGLGYNGLHPLDPVAYVNEAGNVVLRSELSPEVRDSLSNIDRQRILDSVDAIAPFAEHPTAANYQYGYSKEYGEAMLARVDAAVKNGYYEIDTGMKPADVKTFGPDDLKGMEILPERPVGSTSAGRGTLPDVEANTKFQALMAKEGITDPVVIEARAQEVATLSRAALERATAAEPGITQDVVGSARDLGGEMYKLDTRLKGEGSMQRKALQDAIDKGVDPATAIAGLSDTVRYTAVFPEENLVSGVTGMRDKLISEGYKVVTDGSGNPKIKNGFYDGSSYKAVNMQFESPTGQRVEVKIHTDESLAADNATHAIFERMRTIDPASDEYLRLDAERTAIAMGVHIPTGATDALNGLGVPLQSLATYGRGVEGERLVAGNGDGSVRGGALLTSDRATDFAAPAVRPDQPIYDLIIGGGGPGGAMAASHFAGLGGRPLVIEARGEVGTRGNVVVINGDNQAALAQHGPSTNPVIGEYEQFASLGSIENHLRAGAVERGAEFSYDTKILGVENTSDGGVLVTVQDADGVVSVHRAQAYLDTTGGRTTQAGRNGEAPAIDNANLALGPFREGQQPLEFVMGQFAEHPRVYSQMSTAGDSTAKILTFHNQRDGMSFFADVTGMGLSAEAQRQVLVAHAEALGVDMSTLNGDIIHFTSTDRIVPEATDGRIMLGGDSVAWKSPYTGAGMNQALRDGIYAADTVWNGSMTGNLDAQIAEYGQVTRDAHEGIIVWGPQH